jgi:hypothetical protein
VRSYLGVRAEKMTATIDAMTDLIIGSRTGPVLTTVAG